ncbi:hypothetical protein [Zoogloea sp.]|uniref:hypothetical protein n=1 Tax=Zoogloea sp. TaxID=49181 RepID=UPI0035AF444C
MIRLYQVFYDDATRQAIGPGFIPYDNRHPPVSGWFEYGCIRDILLNTDFADDDRFGLFSPRLAEKTGLGARDLIARCEATDAAVVAFSPFLDQLALFPNVFAQGDFWHPGLIDVTREAFERIGLDVDVVAADHYADQTRSIFSNYFVARMDVWRIWFGYAERLFDLCEHGTDALARRLNGTTDHRAVAGHYPLKIFVMERLICAVLEKLGLDAEIGLDYPRYAACNPEHANAIDELLVLDALKAQYRRTGHPAFRDLHRRRSAALDAWLRDRKRKPNDIYGDPARRLSLKGLLGR